MDINTQKRVLEFLAPLGGSFFDHASQMERANIASFKPILDFQFLFCSSEEMRSAYSLYLVELAKERVSNVPPYAYLQNVPGPGYRSPVLEDFRKSRANAGNDPNAYDMSKRWLLELSPCRAAETQFSLTNPSEHDRRKKPYIEKQKILRRVEINTYSTNLSTRDSFEKKDRLALCKSVFEDVLSSAGYKHDASRSSTACLVFAKPFLDQWSLCWTIDGYNLFPPGCRPENPSGYLDLFLELRTADCKGLKQEDRDEGRRIVIPYQYAAPIDGTDWGYRRFESLEELETLTRINLVSYSLFQEALEDKLLAGLSPHR